MTAPFAPESSRSRANHYLRVRRTLTVAVGILAVGAILPPLFAWLVAWRVGPTWRTLRSGWVDVETSAADRQAWDSCAPDHWPSWPRIAAETRAFAVQCRSMRVDMVFTGMVDDRPETTRALQSTGSYQVIRIAYGWPFPCLSMGAWDESSMFGAKRSGTTGWDVGTLTLPASPIWSGVIANTVIYTWLISFLLGGAFVLRRLFRRKRGRCPDCGYPAGTSPVCTECGTDVKPRPAISNPGGAK